MLLIYLLLVQELIQLRHVRVLVLLLLGPVARERRGEECGFVVHRYARRRRRRGGDRRDREAGQEASHHDRLFY